MGHHVSLTSLEVNFNRYTLSWGSLKQRPELVDKTAHAYVGVQKKINKNSWNLLAVFSSIAACLWLDLPFWGTVIMVICWPFINRGFLTMFTNKKPIVLGVFLKCKAQILFFFESVVLFISQPLAQKYMRL